MNVKSLLTALLISCIIVLYVSNKSQALSQPKSAKLYMLSSGQEAQMLSSIIVTEEGKVIVIDGGWTYDAERLSSVIKCHGGTVDAWLITHADPDHVGALYRIMQGAYNIKIKSIYCSLASSSFYQRYSSDTSDFIELFRKDLYNFPVYETTKNMRIRVGSTLIYVLNYRYEFGQNSINNSSIVYKIFVGDTSVLYLGDLGYEGGEKLLVETPSYLLSSDIVQMSHHGQAGVGQDVYNAISPKIALWPTPQWLWTNQNGTGQFKTLETRFWMQEIKCKNYTTADGDICLDLENIL